MYSESQMNTGMQSKVSWGAGLGGGMGIFLAGPLVEELRATLDQATSQPLDCRRMLELLVPLVYRPAMKVLSCSIRAFNPDMLHLALNVDRGLSFPWLYQELTAHMGYWMQFDEVMVITSSRLNSQ